MKEIVLKRGIKTTKVKIYSDIDQMPVDVFQRANKYWMLHDKLGADLRDIDDKHLRKLALVAGDKEKTVDAIDKLRILINNILNEVNVENMAFACLVYSIDGQVIDDRSDDNLRLILERLSAAGLTNEIVKKKAPEKLYMKIWSIISRRSLTIRPVSMAG